MSRVTRFAARDPGPTARMAGFVAHLRENGLRLGVAETDLALSALAEVAPRPDDTRRALRAVFTGCKDEAERFDPLFDSFWMDGGRVKQKVIPNPSSSTNDAVHSSRDGTVEDAGSSGAATSPDDQDGGDVDSDGTGKLVATEIRNLLRKDLRAMIRPEEIALAEDVARRLGAALKDKRSRRRIAARKGDRLHFRKTIRRSLSTGGEPVTLLRKKRPNRARNIVALCDVSGSMTVYARVFLAFLAGLMRADKSADAYLFHTRLVRITEALRDKDTMRAIGRMSLLADGFGGGSKIGPSLAQFADSYAKQFVDGRSVVLILSDGYDTEPPKILRDALIKLKKRGGKVVWLNPLKGWDDYEPIAEGMAVALPHLDLFKAANTLGDLAALEKDLVVL